MKKISILLLLLLLLLPSCQKNKQPEKIIRVGLLLARGGLGDRSFNDSAYSGLQEAERKYSIRFQTIDYTTEEANAAALNSMADEQYDIIIGIGYESGKPVEEAAKRYPEINFAIIDTVVDAPNVYSVTFREEEGDFLMGVLAARLTESKKIGFIGGVDIPVIRKIENGFRQGIEYADSSVEFVSEMAGTFVDPEVGKELALKQYESGVDIIYNGAGRTGLGIIAAASEAQKYTLGTSGDQRHLAPGYMLGNRPKRMDTAVIRVIEMILNDSFKGGSAKFGLKEEGLTMGPFDDSKVSKDILNEIKDLEKKIINGDITVKVE
jgi:basic membrane protein A